MTGDAYERFRRDYAPVFLQYLSDRGEPGRRAAYELGRRAISQQLSVLDLARIHHGTLLDVLKTHRSPQELDHIAQAASEFLVEALAVFEMTQRGFTELLSTLGSDEHHAQDIQAELEQQQALERATGVLMERHGLPADTAAERIRQTAARQGTTMSEAAARLLRQPSAEVGADPDDSAYRLPHRTSCHTGHGVKADDGRFRGAARRWPAARPGWPERAVRCRSDQVRSRPSVVGGTSAAGASRRASAGTNGLLTVKRRAWVGEKR